MPTNNSKRLRSLSTYSTEILEIGKTGEVWMIALNHETPCYILDVFKHFESMWVKSHQVEVWVTTEKRHTRNMNIKMLVFYIIALVLNNFEYVL